MVKYQLARKVKVPDYEVWFRKDWPNFDPKNPSADINDVRRKEALSELVVSNISVLNLKQKLERVNY